MINLNDLKNQLLDLENQLKQKVQECDETSNQIESKDLEAKKILSLKSEDIIRLNIGGKQFATTLERLMSIPDTLFYKVLISKQIDATKEIFFDRSPFYFEDILNFLRYGKINLFKYNKDQLEELKSEAEYFDILELEKKLETLTLTKEIIKVEVNAYYYENGTIVGTTDHTVLSDPNLQNGICTTYPGWFKAILNTVHIIEEIEIGGYTGKNDWIYAGGYGNGSIVYTSSDNKTWINVGTIPSGFGQTILKFKVNRSEAQYIKFEGNCYFGIGYLKFL